MTTLEKEAEEYLAHHGVLGMKWGVHRAHSTGARGPSDHKGPSGTKSAPAAPAVKLGKHAAKKAAKKAAQIESVDKQIADMRENLKILNHNKAIMDGHLKAHGKAGRTLADPEVRRALVVFNELSANIPKQEQEIARMEKVRASLSHADEIEEFLEHFGVLGMKWGVHRARTSSPHPSSPEAATARQLHARARSGGTHSLTNAELQTLVQRMNLETQYSNLNQRQVNKGKKIVGDLLLEVGKQTAKQLIIKGGEKGGQMLIKKLVKK